MTRNVTNHIRSIVSTELKLCGTKRAVKKAKTRLARRFKLTVAQLHALQAWQTIRRLRTNSRRRLNSRRCANCTSCNS